jgi:hypothetical protein
MARKLGKRQENMLAKIAAALGKDVQEIKEAAAPLYTTEARVYQEQAIYNFFTVRIKPERRSKETDAEFDARYKEWRFKICEECDTRFAYAYSYDGVKFCSLECVDAALRKIGLQVTPNRDTKKRYGNQHPAIVPASALLALETAFPDSEGIYDDPSQTDLPKLPEESVHSESA